jgi:hypothetical protein
MQNPFSIWHVMGKARNNLAHGNNRRQSDDQLAMPTRIGHTVAVALVPHAIGVATTRLATAIAAHHAPRSPVDPSRWHGGHRLPIRSLP